MERRHIPRKRLSINVADWPHIEQTERKEGAAKAQWSVVILILILFEFIKKSIFGNKQKVFFVLFESTTSYLKWK